jgi:hypothetical protein
VQTSPYSLYVQGFASDYLNSPGAHNHLQNTGQEFDGSDSGARPDEAVSWGKIRADAETVKVGRLIPSLRDDAHLLVGLCRRNACVPTSRRCDIRSGHRFILDMTKLVDLYLQKHTGRPMLMSDECRWVAYEGE